MFFTVLQVMRLAEHTRVVRADCRIHDRDRADRRRQLIALRPPAISFRVVLIPRAARDGHRSHPTSTHAVRGLIGARAGQVYLCLA